MNRSPLESKVGGLIISHPEHIEVDIEAKLPSQFSVAVWLDTSRFTGDVRAAWRTLGGTYQIQAELCLFCPWAREVGSECPANPLGPHVSFESKIIDEDKDICAEFVVDIPSTFYPPHHGEYTYALIASVMILTTDAAGTKSIIVRAGCAALDISSRDTPLFTDGVAPCPWASTRH
ncbi:hypothetical protein RSOLAG22IIIB_01886 [Rhizoctonia solani]|uniref:Uncharacterized protein n=1 Tax=Rhizoctonia solani TaxID=456999 RepID=A0A0K6GBM9_9AGAM|nr:hypothetical protein RSOLAG22IIIB_01886 [Rhizoctonia solani]